MIAAAVRDMRCRHDECQCVSLGSLPWLFFQYVAMQITDQIYQFSCTYKTSSIREAHDFFVGGVNFSAVFFPQAARQMRIFFRLVVIV